MFKYCPLPYKKDSKQHFNSSASNNKTNPAIYSSHKISFDKLCITIAPSHTKKKQINLYTHVYNAIYNINISTRI